MRNSFPTPAVHRDVVSEAEQRRQVRGICPAHSKALLVSPGGREEDKGERGGDSYIGKYIEM